MNNHPILCAIIRLTISLTKLARLANNSIKINECVQYLFEDNIYKFMRVDVVAQLSVGGYSFNKCCILGRATVLL